MPETQRPRRLNPTLIALVGGIIGLTLAYQLVFGLFDGDPTGLMRVGQADATLVAEQLGRTPVVAEGEGHDGFYFFQLALDPVLSDPAALASFDDPAHRAARLVYPLVAGGAGGFPASWIPWTLILLNVFAFGFGTLATGRLAQHLGASPVIGLFFSANFGLLFALSIDGSSVLASALLMAGLLALSRGKDRLALSWFALMVLTREFYILFAFGALAYRHRREPSKLVQSVAAVALPYVIVRSFYTWRFRDAAIEEAATNRNFGVPFRGIADSVPAWRESSTIELLAIAIVLGSMIGILILAVRRPSTLSISGLVALPPTILFTADILSEAYDVSRVLAPLAILFPLAALASSGTQREPAPRAPAPD